VLQESTKRKCSLLLYRGQYKKLDLTFDLQVAVYSGVMRAHTACGASVDRELDGKFIVCQQLRDYGNQVKEQDVDKKVDSAPYYKLLSL
jgi:hypothetical protein